MAMPAELGRQREHATWWRIGVSVTALIALVSLCLQYGFETPIVPVELLIGVQIVAVAAYIAAVGALVINCPTWRIALRRYGWELALILIGVLILCGEYEARHQRVLAASTIYVVTVQVLLVGRFLVGVIRWNLEMSQRDLRPGRMITTLFVLVITVGGSLLSLPKSLSPEMRANPSVTIADRVAGGFFTATSAACVTGLVVFDTEHDYTRFGQVVILVLIQLGGLGIMIFASLFGVLAGRQLSVRHSLALQDAYSQQTVGEMRSTIRFVVLATFVCELLGAAACYPMFAETCPEMSDRLFHCIFHAVSAFCNAGFALQSDSLVSYRSAWGVYVGVMPLIIVGGLGFPVLRDLWGYFAAKVRGFRARRRLPLPLKRSHHGPRYRLQLHTRLVLLTSLVVTLLPAILFFAFESIDYRQAAFAGPESMRNMPAFDRGCAALFQSVTARTAGFNTVDMSTNGMSPATHFLLMIIMFIGGSPASTAGGVKTVALSVLLLSVVGTLRGRNRAEAFGRTVPQPIIERAAVVVFVMGALVALTTLGLCLTTPGTVREMLFEAVSACGTVGLSTGLTTELTLPGQIIIMAAMFAGRLGPLTVLIALAGGEHPARYEYPEETVTIG